MPSHSYNSFSADFAAQIRFLKKERRSTLKSAKTFKKNTLPHELLIQKAKVYTDIEQNLYALRILASQLLKS
jgi:hypothetical protein